MERAVLPGSAGSRVPLLEVLPRCWTPAAGFEPMLVEALAKQAGFTPEVRAQGQLVAPSTAPVQRWPGPAGPTQVEPPPSTAVPRAPPPPPQIVPLKDYDARFTALLNDTAGVDMVVYGGCRQAAAALCAREAPAAAAAATFTAVLSVPFRMQPSL